MKVLGFSHQWIEWILSCVSSVSYSVKFNRTLLGSFNPTRGLRQRDPLSAFRFLIVANGLLVLLQREISDGDITSLKIYHGALGISYMLFTDDMLLFLKADVD